MVSYVVVFSAVPDFRATCKAHLRRNAALFRRCQLRADVKQLLRRPRGPSQPSFGRTWTVAPLEWPPRPAPGVPGTAAPHTKPSSHAPLPTGTRRLGSALPLRGAVWPVTAETGLGLCRSQKMPLPGLPVTLSLTFLSSLPSSQALVAVMISMCLARTVAPWPFSVCWDFSNRLSSLSRH